MWGIQPKKRLVLSLSGGGVKGAIVTQFLENLENELKKRDINKPLHEFFDFFVGTSTGGLIVGGIAHKKMTANELNNNFYNHKIIGQMMYQSIEDRLFGLFQFKPKYHEKEKRKTIQQITGDSKFDETDKKIMITAYDITVQEPILFKSWHQNNIKLLNVMDATSAAPGYFPSVEYKPEHWAIDGGIFANNPSECAYVESLKIFKEKDDIRILSIGTGSSKDISLGKNSECFGSIEWALEGDLLDTLLDAPLKASNHRIEQMTKRMNHKYLHIQEKIDNTSLDDASEENIHKLKKIGNEWWDIHKDELMSFLLD